MESAIVCPNLARDLVATGVVQFDAFRLKLHETNPDAPLSPFYFSFRRPPQGSLTDDHIRRLSEELLLCFTIGTVKYDAVVGVPEAGEPFAEAFAKAAKVPLLLLGKEGREGRRQIVISERFLVSAREARIGAGARVLVIDDLITQAHSKIEAIHVLRGERLSVQDVLVCLDREQGGQLELAKESCNLHAGWTISDFLQFSLEEGLITPAKYDEALDYVRSQRAEANSAA